MTIIYVHLIIKPTWKLFLNNAGLLLPRNQCAVMYLHSLMIFNTFIYFSVIVLMCLFAKHCSIFYICILYVCTYIMYNIICFSYGSILCVCPYIPYNIIFLRQAFTLWPRLFSNWWFFCLMHPTAWINGMCHHIQLSICHILLNMWGFI